MSERKPEPRVGKENDGRRKLSDWQRSDIIQLHKIGTPIREIAREYNGTCSRRLIQIIIFPERYEKMKKRAIDNKAWEPYNTKEYRKIVMRKHRAKIKKLLKEGKIKKT